VCGQCGPRPLLRRGGTEKIFSTQFGRVRQPQKEMVPFIRGFMPRLRAGCKIPQAVRRAVPAPASSNVLKRRSCRALGRLHVSPSRSSAPVDALARSVVDDCVQISSANLPSAMPSRSAIPQDHRQTAGYRRQFLHRDDHAFGIGRRLLAGRSQQRRVRLRAVITASARRECCASRRMRATAGTPSGRGRDLPRTRANAPAAGHANPRPEAASAPADVPRS
jgi:hypothetical protein